MKAFITPTYTFDASAKTVDLSNIPDFDIKRLLAIINQTAGILIYSTASATLGYASEADGIVTLDFDTTTMSDTDDLQIVYEQIGRLAAADAHPVVLSTEDYTQLQKLAALGTTTDAAVTNGSGTSSLISIQKGILNNLGYGLDDAVIYSANFGTLTGYVKGTLEWLGFIKAHTEATSGKLPSTLGQAAKASSLSVALSTEHEAQVGSLTETAPASDTASSGLNGRLQRIAQRLTSLIALFPLSLGQKTMANSFAVTLASDQSAIPTTNTPSSVAGTVSSAQITVGTSAVRATVSGSAPSASRKKLMIKPSGSNSGRIFLGASGVTTSTGMEIIGPDRLEFEMDAGDYYLISDMASQSVDILEKV